MDSEDDRLRPAPRCPYEAHGKTLTVPAAAIEATLKLLQRAGQNESCVFWYGPRTAAGSGSVVYVAAPRQRMSWGNYGVEPQALAQLVHHLADDWKTLAQIHSHPGWLVEHSNYDDRMASSRNALSIVFPFYGRPREPFPDAIGVHEWQHDYWHLLDASAARRRIVVGSGPVTVEDFR